MTQESIEKGAALLKDIKRLKEDLHMWKTKGIKISSTGASRLLDIEDTNYLVEKYEAKLSDMETELEELA